MRAPFIDCCDNMNAKRATPADKIGIEVALTSWEVALTAATADLPSRCHIKIPGVRSLEKLYGHSKLEETVIN